MNKYIENILIKNINKPTKIKLSNILLHQCLSEHIVFYTLDDKWHVFGKKSEELTNVINRFNSS